MIYFDTVTNLTHDIWKGLAPSPIRALFTRSNEILEYNTRYATKGNYVQKEVKLEIFERSFQISPNWRDLSTPICQFLFETLLDRDDYVEVDTLT